MVVRHGRCLDIALNEHLSVFRIPFESERLVLTIRGFGQSPLHVHDGEIVGGEDARHIGEKPRRIVHAVVARVETRAPIEALIGAERAIARECEGDCSRIRRRRLASGVIRRCLRRRARKSACSEDDENDDDRDQGNAGNDPGRMQTAALNGCAPQNGRRRRCAPARRLRADAARCAHGRSLYRFGSLVSHANRIHHGEGKQNWAGIAGCSRSRTALLAS